VLAGEGSETMPEEGHQMPSEDEAGPRPVDPGGPPK
jgi:hypothetical protein